MDPIVHRAGEPTLPTIHKYRRFTETRNFVDKAVTEIPQKNVYPKNLIPRFLSLYGDANGPKTQTKNAGLWKMTRGPSTQWTHAHTHARYAQRETRTRHTTSIHALKRNTEASQDK